MDKLPDNVLAKVLSKCKSKNLRLVCSHWKNVIEKYQGILIVKGLPSRVSILEPEDCFSHLTICTTYADCIPGLVNFSKSKTQSENDEISKEFKESLDKDESRKDLASAVTDVTKESETSVVESIPKDEIPPEPISSTPKIEEPELISKLSFIGLVPLNISGEIISKCAQNLTQLHIHISSLSGIHLPSGTLVLDVPKLKSFVINSAGVKEEAARTMKNPTGFLKFKKIYTIFSSLLSNNEFPQLETLTLDLPYYLEKEHLLIASISGFLFKHRNSIKSFTYLQNFMINSDSNGNDDEQEGEDLSVRSLAQCAMQLKKVQLKNLHIHLITQQDSGPLWKNFLLHETQMEKLIFTGNSRIPFPSNTLTANGSTLTTLILEVRDDVDVKCLKPCKVLKKLVIISKANYDDYEEGSKPTKASEMDNPRIRNIKELPDSVEILKIQHLKVNKDEVDFILVGKPIKEVEFYDCGNEEDFGIGLKTIVMVFEHKRIQKFSFMYSLNRKSLKDPTLPPSGILLSFVIIGGYSVTDFEVQGQLKGHTYEPITEEMEEFIEFTHKDVFDFNEDYQTGSSDFQTFVEVAGNESDNSTEYETVSEDTDSSSVDTSGSDSSDTE